ncbi:MAG: hypothetical protein AAGA55_01875 [Planctomycetota bacterium]
MSCSIGNSAVAIVEVDAAAELARLARMDLVLRASPGPDDYVIAGHALAIASAMHPDDAELARLVASAAWASGDRALLMDATRNIVRNDPQDTVAQLRLLSANINARQTVEERLAAYERILGPAGEGLDASVRSRLSLDAALLEREVGNTERFRERLLDAVRLDITNKDAVSLGVRTFVTRETGVEELIGWQIRLLYSDPFDPHVHMTIARVCAGQGALDAAQRFLENSVVLFEVSGIEVPALLQSQRLALQWQQVGPRGVLDSLNQPLYEAREQAAEIIAARKEAGEPYDDIRDPDEIRYDLPTERIRLFAANALQDDEAIEASLRDLTLTTQQTVRDLADAMNAPGADGRAILQELTAIFVNLQVSRGMVGRDADRIREEIETFNNSIPGSERDTQKAAIWLTYARGEYQQAIDEVGDVRDTSLAGLMVAMAGEQTGDLERSSRIYRAQALSRPLDAFGAFARSRLVAMGREQDVISDAGRFLESRLSRVPAWMDRMLSSPRSFMLLQADAEHRTTTVTDRARVRLRLRNSASIPMSLGASRSIGSRMLLIPRAVSGGGDDQGRPTPSVIDLDRRLRMEPLEEIDVTLPGDSAYGAWLRMVNAHISQRDRYRAVQSFQPAPLGGLGPGPFGLIGETAIVQQNALGLARVPVEELIAVITSGDAARLRAAAIATLSRFYQQGSDLALDTDERRDVVAAWQGRFASLTDAERACVLLILPHAMQSPSFEPFDQAVIETVVGEGLAGGGDPGLLAAIALTRVRDPESPLFEVMRNASNEHVRLLGASVSERLGSLRPAWSLVGPGVEAAAPGGRSDSFGGFGP